MHNLNSLIIEGNVVRDPIVKATAKGTPLCLFSIASNRFFKQEDQTTQETSFFDVETWARLAELCGSNCTKGRGVRVVGRLKQDRWVGTDGKRYSKVKVVAEHVEFKPSFKHDSPMQESADQPGEKKKEERMACESIAAQSSKGDSEESPETVSEEKEEVLAF